MDSWPDVDRISYTKLFILFHRHSNNRSDFVNSALEMEHLIGTNDRESNALAITFALQAFNGFVEFRHMMTLCFSITDLLDHELLTLIHNYG